MIFETESRIAQALEHCLSNPVTNGWLIRHGHVPCEANPKTGGLSRTGDPAHALAEVTVGGKGFETRHLCRECAKEFYPCRPGQGRGGLVMSRRERNKFKWQVAFVCWLIYGIGHLCGSETISPWFSIPAAALAAATITARAEEPADAAADA